MLREQKNLHPGPLVDQFGTALIRPFSLHPIFSTVKSPMTLDLEEGLMVIEPDGQDVLKEELVLRVRTFIE